MSKIYGYARVSTTTQSIERQVQNISKLYPDAIIFSESYTGTKIVGRKEFNKLDGKVEAGDTIVFDSVSRMSRNADEGVKKYFEFIDRGINLVFLKEHYIDSEVYKASMLDKVELQGTDEDELFKGINNYFRKLAQKQIRIAFEQAQKEVDDLHQRVSEGIREVKRMNDKIKAGAADGEIKQIGQVKGAKLVIKKSFFAKEKIRKLSKSFGGNLTDAECMKVIGIANNTYYKYKKEIMMEMAEG